MEGSDILATIAQIAMTLAGFTGIVVVLGDPGGRLAPIQIFRVAILITLSLGAMTLALVPFGLDLTGLEGAALWRPASAVLATSSGCCGSCSRAPTSS